MKYIMYILGSSFMLTTIILFIIYAKSILKNKEKEYKKVFNVFLFISMILCSLTTSFTIFFWFWCVHKEFLHSLYGSIPLITIINCFFIFLLIITFKKDKEKLKKGE